MTDALSELVSRAADADNGAFAELVGAYDKAVFRVAQEILQDVSDAEDAAQEAWLAVARRLKTLRDPSSFGLWLYRITANVAIRKRQQRASRPTNVEALEMAFPAAGAPCAGRGSPAESRATQYRDLVPTAMETLSSKDRLVTALHYFGGMPVAEIARLLEVPVGTVKSRLHHARRHLRKEIETMVSRTDRPEHVPPDFRIVIHGCEGDIPWQELFTGSFSGWSVVKGQGYRPLDGDTPPECWQTAGGGLVGEQLEEGTCLATGDATWRDYELSALVTPLKGGNAQLLFRMGESAKAFYMLDMMLGWQAIAVTKVEWESAGKPALALLSVVNYPLEHEREYAVGIAARGWSITTYMDGALVNQVTDFSFRAGRVGLNIWQAKTLFREVRFRLLGAAPGVQ